MREALNIVFGTISAVATLLWFGLHANVFLRFGTEEAQAIILWFAVLLFVLTVAHLGLWFRYEDGSRSTATHIPYFRSLPFGTKVIVSTLIAYVSELCLLYGITGMAGSSQIEPVTKIREFMQDYYLIESADELDAIFGALAGTAAMACYSFVLSAYLLVGKHDRPKPNWFDVFLNYLPSGVFFLNAVIAVAYQEWISAVFAVSIGLYLWRMARKVMIEANSGFDALRLVGGATSAP